MNEWKARAACIGLSKFFFPDAPGKPEPIARQICAGCQVQPECLEYALELNPPYGIWAGTNDKQRKSLRRTRRQVIFT